MAISTLEGPRGARFGGHGGRTLHSMADKGRGPEPEEVTEGY